MKILKLLFLLILPSAAYSQYFEAGILVGGSNYMGDLSSNSSTVYFSETRGAGGIFIRYNMFDMLSFRSGFNFATVVGTDANADNESIRSRNLSFRSNLYEFSLSAEFNIPGYQPYALSRPFSPYLFAGIAVTGTNPKAKYQGEWVELQPLGTEGQGMPGFDNPYSKVILALPFGIGFKYAFSDAWNIGIEAGARKTFSDYLDDVGGEYVEYSTLAAGNGELSAALANRTGEFMGTEPVSVPTGTRRGDALTSDWYFIAGITLSYNFMDNGLVGSRKRTSRRRGCPTD